MRNPHDRANEPLAGHHEGQQARRKTADRSDQPRDRGALRLQHQAVNSARLRWRPPSRARRRPLRNRPAKRRHAATFGMCVRPWCRINRPERTDSPPSNGSYPSTKAPLLRYAARIVNDQVAAQDVVQQAFIRLYRNWREPWEPSPQLSAWLYRTSHNCAVDYLRKESRRRSLHRRQAEERPDAAPPNRGARRRSATRPWRRSGPCTRSACANNNSSCLRFSRRSPIRKSARSPG